MKIKDIIKVLENIAPPHLQEDYDNAGLITGDANGECTGIIVSLDATEEVVLEAIRNNCNMIVAHHPIVFKGLKKITGKNYVEQTIITAIKNDISIYAIHTNLDNVLTGVNGKMADKLGLVNRKILSPKAGILRKLAVFVPLTHKEILLDALFAAGAGDIGRYSECSFSTEGKGTYKAGEGASPFLGKTGELHTENEAKIEVIFPHWLQQQVIDGMTEKHPYEEVAYDIFRIENDFLETGSGLTGELENEITEMEMLAKLQETFDIPAIKHTTLTGKMIKKVALCGGAGSFLIKNAINSGSDIYITSDIKYHEFFDAENKLLLADIGHYESEQFTQDLMFDILREKFLNFAVLKTGVKTNPVHYFTGSTPQKN